MYSGSTPPIADFKIGWICALQVEVDAARAVLDEEYEDIQEAAQYILGRIGLHNVAIACPPAGQIGIGAAAVTAERLRGTFPSIKYYFMIGIGGGAPSTTADVRLGDVVISRPQASSGGVIQYDMGKTGPHGQNQRTGSLNAPPPELLAAVTKLSSNHSVGKTGIRESLEQRFEQKRFAKPLSSTDVLYESSYEHAGGFDCTTCSKDRIVVRPQRREDTIIIHYGLIASGNQVIKDGIARDRLNQDLGGVLCFEMEAAALMNSLPCLVIRGICDYSDSHKNKQWQPFAAAAAAACSREILSYVSSQTPAATHSQDNERPTSSFSSRSTTPVSINRTDSGYLSLPSSKLAQEHTYTTLSNMTLPENERQMLFEALRFDQLESRFMSVKSAHFRTCAWLLSRPELRDWLDSKEMENHHGFLWIKGKAATGKSTIMKFLLSHLKKTKAAAIIAAFFFNARGAAIERSTLGMYQSLLYQLLEQFPHLKSIFDTRLVKLNGQGLVDWDINSLQSLFRLALERLGTHSLICCVDALDECDDDEVQDMVDFFDEVGRTTFSSQKEVRVLLSSRHYPHVTVEAGIELVLEDQAEHTEDIAEYVRSELKAGKTQKVERLREIIMHRCSGIFLWVVLVVDILNKEYRRGRIVAMEKRLEGLPSDVERLFDDILTRGGDCSDETVLCLQWVLHARRPLSIEELYFAIVCSLEEGSVEAWNPGEITTDDMNRFILDASRGLLEQTRDGRRIIQFIHESVREFLMRGRGLNRPPFAPAETFPLRSHEMLKRCCQLYYEGVKIKEFSASPPKPSSVKRVTFSFDLFKPREGLVSKFPFLEYAIQNVLFHSDAAEGLGIYQDEFLTESTKHKWISIHNILYQGERQLYSDEKSILYPFADQNLIHLARKELQRKGVLDGINYGHHWLIYAGLAAAGDEGENLTLQWLRETADSEFLPESQIPTKLLESDAGIQEIMRLLRYRRSLAPGQEQFLVWAARNGSMSLLKLYFAYYDSSSPFVRNGTPFMTALSRAISVGRKDIFQLLLNQCEVVPAVHADLLFIATRHNRYEIVDLLLEKPQVDPSMFGQSLVAATKLRNQSIVEKILNFSNVNVNEIDALGNTALVEAISSGQDQVVRLLLKYPNIDVNVTNNNKQTPLELALTELQDEIVELLISHPAIEINQAPNSDFIPLVWAASQLEDYDRGRPLHWLQYFVKIFIDHPSIDVNIMDIPDESNDSGGSTPLSRAIQSRDLTRVKLLLGHADIDVNLRSGRLLKSPLQEAIETHDNDIIKAITAVGHDVASQEFCQVLNYFMQLDVDLAAPQPTPTTVVRCASEAGIPVSIFLFPAIAKHNVEALSLLLGCDDIDINHKNNKSESPLLVAIWNLNLEAAKLLIAHKDIQINWGDEEGSALSYAAILGLVDFVRLFLEHENIEVDGFLRNKYDPPLLQAIKHGHAPVVELLLKHPKINFEIMNQQHSRMTAAAHAALFGDQHIFKILMKYAEEHSITFDDLNQKQRDIIRHFETTGQVPSDVEIPSPSSPSAYDSDD